MIRGVVVEQDCVCLDGSVLKEGEIVPSECSRCKGTRIEHVTMSLKAFGQMFFPVTLRHRGVLTGPTGPENTRPTSERTYLAVVKDDDEARKSL